MVKYSPQSDPHSISRADDDKRFGLLNGSRTLRGDALKRARAAVREHLGPGAQEALETIRMAQQQETEEIRKPGPETVGRRHAILGKLKERGKLAFPVGGTGEEPPTSPSISPTSTVSAKTGTEALKGRPKGPKRRLPERHRHHRREPEGTDATIDTSSYQPSLVTTPRGVHPLKTWATQLVSSRQTTAASVEQTADLSGSYSPMAEEKAAGFPIDTPPASVKKAKGKKKKQVQINSQLNQEHLITMQDPFPLLHEAILAGYPASHAEKRLKEQLEVFGADHPFWRTTDNHGRPIIHTVIQQRLDMLFDAMILNGGDPTSASAYQRFAGGKETALHVAVQHDAPVDLVNKLVFSYPALVYEQDAKGATALHHAALLGNTMLATVLLKRGARVDVTNQRGHTPLHLAATSRTDDNRILESLIARGADVNALDNKGMTPLDYAERAGNTDKAAFLIEKGAKRKEQVIENQENRHTTIGTATKQQVPPSDAVRSYSPERHHKAGKGRVADRILSGAENPLRNTAIEQAKKGRHPDEERHVKRQPLVETNRAGKKWAKQLVDAQQQDPAFQAEREMTEQRAASRAYDRRFERILKKALKKHGAPLIDNRPHAERLAEQSTSRTSGSDPTASRRAERIAETAAPYIDNSHTTTPTSSPTIKELQGMLKDLAFQHNVDSSNAFERQLQHFTPEQLNAPLNKRGTRLAHVAAGYGLERELVMLMGAGADLDIQDARGKTPKDKLAGVPKGASAIDHGSSSARSWVGHTQATRNTGDDLRR